MSPWPYQQTLIGECGSGRRVSANNPAAIAGSTTLPGKGPFQTFRGETEPGGNMLFSPDPHFQLVVGFLSFRRSIGPLAVHQTERLSMVFCSNATGTPL
jgi:hypothetical protein